MLSKQNSKLNIGTSLSVYVPDGTFDSWFLCVNRPFFKKKKSINMYIYACMYICVYVDICRYFMYMVSGNCG